MEKLNKILTMILVPLVTLLTGSMTLWLKFRVDDMNVSIESTRLMLDQQKEERSSKELMTHMPY